MLLKHLGILHIFFLTLFAFTAKADVTDIFFDLNGTLIDSATVNTPPDRLIKTPGGNYELVYGAENALQEVANRPKTRLSIFSGGSKESIDQIVNQIKLPDGRTLSSVLFKIFSQENLKSGSGLSNKRGFTGMDKKDLRLAALDVDLNRAVIFDDTLGNAMPGQERNFLRLNNVPIFESNQQAEKMIHEMLQKNSPEAMANLDIYLANRNRIIMAIGVFHAAETLAKEKNISLVEALKEIQWERDFEVYRPYNTSNTYIKRGQDFLQKSFPGFKAYHPKIGNSMGQCLRFNLQ